MANIFFLSIDIIMHLHNDQINLFGGSHGIRDQGLLESAIGMPSLGFGDTYIHEDIFEMAAAYAYHIIKNHPFIDGNKRTGMATAIIFLIWNEAPITLSDDTIVDLGVDIANSKLSKDKIAKIFRKHSAFN